MKQQHLNHPISIINNSRTDTHFNSGNLIYCHFCKKTIGQGRTQMLDYYNNHIKKPIVYSDFLRKWAYDPTAREIQLKPIEEEQQKNLWRDQCRDNFDVRWSR